MKILVIGSGGREHALCWCIARSPLVEKLYCAPGNPGTAACAENVQLPVSDLEALASFARDHGVDLTVVGPEAPLCAGIVDHFSERGLRVAGPTQAAARLEGSKAFAKAFMERHGIPTATAATFEDPGEAERYIEAHAAARVVKADGLAAGKGVVVCGSAAEARAAVQRILGGAFGAAGRRVVVEERLQGEEASFMAISDGERIWPLAGSQDHKAAFDGDSGPNTGGMGAYSPAPILDAALEEAVMARVMVPAIRGLAAEGIPYRGVLYAGLMIEPDRSFRVLEFNCRLGDPETQPVLARLGSDLVPYLAGVADGRLPAEPPVWDPRAAVCVVMASGGYPGPSIQGLPIEGIAEAEALGDVLVFHAGTARDHAGRLLTAGGRVLGVTGLGADVAAARARAYQAAERIHFQDRHYRRDIGARAGARRAGA
jgi:phosphoribosylamine--glycine ligase